jgi:thioredoxin-dependent peroxiredoxin
MRDIANQIDTTQILGISPDKPSAQLKFAEKHSLGYPLLCDTDHAVAEAFDVWKEKSFMGRLGLGVVRSAFLVGTDGRIEHAWYKVSPKDTPKNLLEALAVG